MKSIALSLIGRCSSADRDHCRAFTDSARGPHGQPAYHPLGRVGGMMLRFRNWNPEYNGGGEDLERVALLLDGNELPNIGLRPSTLATERYYRIPRLLVFRESPVGYRMRVVCLAVPTESADAFDTELVAVRQFMTASNVIGTLTSIATGQRENEKPPMSYVWDPHPISSSNDRTDVFVFLQVNREDRPGLRDRRSCWIRLKQHCIFKNIVCENDPSNPSKRQFTSWNDLWPLFEKISLVSHR